MSHPGINMTAKVITAFLSKGNRPGQEDYALSDRDKGIFVVADGFGGPIPGAEAAKIACESIRQFLFKEAGDLEATLPFVLRTYFSLAGNVLFNSMIHANRKLNSFNKGKGVHEKGGASALACFVDGDLLAVANVGICSGWIFRNGKSHEMVVPRSLGRLVDPFGAKYNREEFQVPLIALGVAEDLEPEIFEYKINPGDWVVLSTDGVTHDMVQRLLKISQQGLDPSSATKRADQVLREIQLEDNAATLVILF